MKSSEFTFAGLSLIALASPLIAGGTPVSTIDTAWDGPLLEDNRRARIQVVRMFGTPEVQIDYLDNHGSRFDTMKDVMRKLDVYLQKVPKIAPYLPDSYRDGVSIASGDKSFPFQMHLLTISPLIVLAVPRERRESTCSGGNFSTGLIYSDALPGDCYTYLATPKIRPGSFWFSPDLENPGQRVPEGQKTYSINLKTSRLDLIANNEVWDIQRHILKPCRTSSAGCIQEEVANPRYVVSPDGSEVTDMGAKLIWQRCLVGMKWNGKSCAGKAGTFTWDEASIEAPKDANATGMKWRVPMWNELSKIGSHTSKVDAFPELTDDRCWSASKHEPPGTARVYSCDHAYNVNTMMATNEKLAVRLVRNAQ